MQWGNFTNNPVRLPIVDSTNGKPFSKREPQNSHRFECQNYNGYPRLKLRVVTFLKIFLFRKFGNPLKPFQELSSCMWPQLILINNSVKDCTGALQTTLSTN